MSWQSKKRRVVRKIDVASMSMARKIVLSFYFLAYLGFISNFLAQAKQTNASSFLSSFILQLFGFTFVMGVVTLLMWLLFKIAGVLLKPFVR